MKQYGLTKAHRFVIIPWIELKENSLGVVFRLTWQILNNPSLELTQKKNKVRFMLSLRLMNKENHNILIGSNISNKMIF